MASELVSVEEVAEGTIRTSKKSVELTCRIQAQDFDPLSTKVIAMYLPSEVSDPELQQLCETKGQLRSFRLVRNPRTGKSRGYAFAEYISSEDATRACNELSGFLLYGKRIKVCPARPQLPEIKHANLHISGLSPTWNVRDFYRYFRPSGKVLSCKLLLDPVTGVSRGTGFLRFASYQQARHAHYNFHNTTPPGTSQPIDIDFADANGPNKWKRIPIIQAIDGATLAAALSTRFDSLRASRPAVPWTSGCVPAPAAPVVAPAPRQYTTWPLFVGNLSLIHGEQFLRELFVPYGLVESVQITSRGTANGGGHGFVHMIHAHEAIIACQNLNNHLLAKDQYLLVTFKPHNSRATP